MQINFQRYLKKNFLYLVLCILFVNVFCFVHVIYAGLKDDEKYYNDPKRCGLLGVYGFDWREYEAFQCALDLEEEVRQRCAYLTMNDLNKSDSSAIHRYQDTYGSADLSKMNRLFAEIFGFIEERADYQPHNPQWTSKSDEMKQYILDYAIVSGFLRVSPSIIAMHSAGDWDGLFSYGRTSYDPSQVLRTWFEKNTIDTVVLGCHRCIDRHTVQDEGLFPTGKYKYTGHGGCLQC